MWFVYILECKNGQYYTGITDNVDQRFSDHKNGKGGQFTRRYGVAKLLYKKSYANKHEAALREKQIKGWSHRKKLMLINGIYT